MKQSVFNKKFWNKVKIRDKELQILELKSILNRTLLQELKLFKAQNKLEILQNEK